MKRIIGIIMAAVTFWALFISSVISVGMTQALIGWLILAAIFGWIVLMIHLLHD